MGRLRAGSLPYTHPDDRCNDTAGGNEFKTQTRYHYESKMSLNKNKADVVWVSSTLNKNRMRGSTKPDPLADAGYESTTDDEGVTRNFPKVEVIVPQGNANSDQLAVSGSVVPSVRARQANIFVRIWPLLNVTCIHSLSRRLLTP